MKRCKFATLFFLFVVLLPAFSFSSYNIVDPWSDRMWLGGWYTAAVCLGQNENLTAYTPTIPPDLPNGSIVYSAGDLNNYISYGSEGAYYNKPQRYSYECDCDCDEDGCTCHTCYGCRYERTFVTISSLGFGAGAWDIDRYGSALEKIEYARWANATLTGDRDGVAAELENALSKYLEAVQFYNACKASDTYAAANYLAGTYGDTNVVRWISYEQYLALAHPNQPSLPGSPCSASMPRANGPACKEYPVKWREAARSAMTALAKSFSSADKNTGLLQQQYEQMDYAGLCDPDYNENPKTTCLKTRGALEIINEKTKEATYGQLALAMEKRTSIQQNAYCFPPNLTDYNAAMDYLWADNGFNPKVVRLKDDADAAFMQANQIYNEHYEKAAGLLSRIGEVKNELENEKLDRITEAVTLDVFEKTKTGTIAERAGAWKESKEKADGALSAAATAMKQKPRGYLKEGTARAKEAAAGYAGLESSAAEIKKDAAAVVKEKSDSAQSLLQQLAGFYQRNKNEKVAYYYQLAKDMAAKGDSAKTLGDKYAFYAGAINYARAGLNNGQIMENETQPLALQLADLIRRAEIDGINVETEKMLLGSMDTEKTYDQPLLQQCVESIITKASIKYGHLSKRKAELLQKINASGVCGADLAGDLKKADEDLVGTAGIDYINALGKLKKVDEEYSSIGKELEACEEKIALANINVEKMVSNGGMIKIDEPVKTNIFLIFTNTGLQKSTHISVPVELGINATLLLTDITSGKENIESVRTEGTKTIFTLKEIKPLRTFSINAEKNMVLARTVSAERTAIGTAGKSRNAEITEKRTIEVYGTGQLALPNGVDSITIKGKGSNYVKPGTYEVTYSYKIKNAYTVSEKVETSTIGSNVQVKKMITIKPSVDITTLPFYISIDYQNASSPAITSLETMITNKKCSNEGCSFDINNIKANKTTTIYFEFIVNDAQKEAAAISLTLPDTDNCFGSGKKCDELPSELQMKIAGINAANEANDTGTALRLGEEYESILTMWEIGQRANYDEVVEIKDRALKEKAEIEAAIKLAKTDSAIVKELEKRKEMLEQNIEKAQKTQTISEELTLMREIEKTGGKTIINDYMRNITAQYNELKARLARTGETGTPLPFIAVEQKLSESELSGDFATLVELADALAEAADYVMQKEAEMERKLAGIDNEYLLMKQDAAMLAKEYKEQQAEAKDTEWETLFNVDPEGMERTISEIEDALEDGNYKLATIKIAQLQERAKAMNSVLEQAKNEAESMLLNARNMYMAKREGMGWDARQMFENEIKSIAEAALNKKYVAALKLARELINKISAYKPESINIWLAIAAAVLLIAAAGLYYTKKKSWGGFSGYGSGLEIPGLTKKKKEYKKLERVNE